MQLLLLLSSLLGAALVVAGLAAGSRRLALVGAAVAACAATLQYVVGRQGASGADEDGRAGGGDGGISATDVASAGLASQSKLPLVGLALATAFVYFLSNPRPQDYFDYTYRIAGALLGGDLGLTEQPPSWLNEMVPHGGRYYSVFPLGAVLSMLPVALLKAVGVVETFPAAFVVAAAAGAASLLFYMLSLRYDISPARRWLLVLSVMFGTWTWCNLSFGGSWQIALGLAVVGQLGALYFTLVEPRPLSAGLFFALAFGNRTEIILLAPIFIYLACRDRVSPPRELAVHWPTLLKFSALPLLLGAATLGYNYFRFQSPFDFGYARIPGVLQEPWYRDGLFSLSAVPRNAHAMLFETWRVSGERPYLIPKGFGGSIFLASPLLLTLFRGGARDPELKAIAWASVALLTIVLWLHGNPGGWQFSYRYAMILLPWLFLILLENGPRAATVTETALAAVSVAINASATYLFQWTDYVKP